MEKYDLFVMQGETFLKTVRFTEGGEVIDLSGYTGACQVREYPGNGKLLADVNVSITPEEGRVDLYIGAEVTAEMEAGAYVWDFRLDSDADVRRFYVGGRFFVLPSVTK